MWTHKVSGNNSDIIVIAAKRRMQVNTTLYSSSPSNTQKVNVIRNL